MSILSDITIQELCQLPETIFDHLLYQQLISQTTSWPLAKHAAENLKNSYRQQATRPPNDRERSAFIPMIEPFHPELVRTVEHRDIHGGDLVVEDRKIISMGLTSYGYDVCLNEDVKLFTNIHSVVIDPKRFDEQKCLVDAKIQTDEDGSKYVILPPHSYMLGVTVEYFRIPRDIMVVCLGKSTYARCGAIVNATPIEPGFEGNVVIEISNSTPSPMRVYLNEGIAQFLFYRGDRPCKTSYGDRGGKYQGQRGVTLPKV